MKKRIMALGLSLVMLATIFSGCGSKDLDGEKDVPELVEDELVATPKTLEYNENGLALAAENEKFQLFLTENAEGFIVKEIATGREWSSTANSFNYVDSEIEGAEVEDPTNVHDFSSDYVPNYDVTYWKQARSMFRVDYIIQATAGTNATTNNFYSYDVLYDKEGTLMCECEVLEIENGVRLSYDAQEYSMKLSLDLTLNEKGLVATIPYECIEEYGDKSIVSITMLPYFADAIDSNDGFYFYPDGSGAIMEFNDKSHNTPLSTGKAMNFSVYGDILKYKNMMDVLDEGEPEIMLPVFGANINGNAFIAIIDEGVSSSTITVDPAMNDSTDASNQIYVNFNYRRQFLDPRDENQEAKKMDVDMITGDRSIEYIFLDEGKSTYSDMAVAYRNYLIEDCGVQDLKNDSTIDVSLDLFMGINEEGTILDSYKIVTTFDQAKKILKEFEEAGINDIQLQLKGWTKNGYFTGPDKLSVNSDIGGSKGLKSLVNYIKDKNIQLSLEANLIEAADGSDGYSKRDDVVYLGNNTLLNGNDIYILSPRKSNYLFKSFLSDMSKNNINGISLYSLGQYVPYNYNEDDLISQDQTVEIWKNMLDTAMAEGMNVSVQGGNSYVIGRTNKITNLPYEDSGYIITTKSVPFYQIAVHGLVEYTGKAANISSDLNTEKLKWIELGYTPYFELTYSGSEDLMYTKYSSLFSSEYASWIDDCASIYKEMNEELSEISDALIMSHEEIEPELYKVVYDNGKVVYINYSDSLKIIEGTGIHVAAGDYVVK